MAADSGFYRIDMWGDFVGAGVTGARYCTLHGVAKVNPSQDSYLAANEFICGRLGLTLGLPVPPGVLTTTDTGAVAYVVLRFGAHAERPPPIDVNDFVEDRARVAAGVLVFDTWVLNGDRHQGNLAYSRHGLPANIFDHSHAFLGPSAGNGAATLGFQRDAGVHVGCLGQADFQAEMFETWFSRAEAVTDDYIEDVVEQAREAQALPSAIDVDAAKSTLIYRRGKLRHLFESALTTGQLPNIKRGNP